MHRLSGGDLESDSANIDRGLEVAESHGKITAEGSGLSLAEVDHVVFERQKIPIAASNASRNGKSRTESNPEEALAEREMAKLSRRVAESVIFSADDHRVERPEKRKKKSMKGKGKWKVKPKAGSNSASSSSIGNLPKDEGRILL